VERRLVSLDPGAVDRVVAGALALARRGGTWRAGTEEVSAEAVRDLVGALAKQTGVPAWGGPLAGEREITLAVGAVEQTIVLAGEDVQRRGEPVVLRVGPAARALFAIDPVTLADRRLLELDPYTITEIRVADRGAPEEVAVRGATLESWTGMDPARAVALRDALATLSAEAVVAASARREHGLDPPRRVLTVVTEGGEQVIELGEGCHARRRGEGRVTRLREKVCAALLADREERR
jgi:hypothetical protein